MIGTCAFGAQVTGLEGSRPGITKIHAALTQHLAASAPNAEVKAWILFTDKGFATKDAEHAAIRNLRGTYDPRAVMRRALRRAREGLFDAQDLPVSQRYLDAVARTGVTLKRTSKWVNGVSVIGTSEQLARVADLGFVKQIQPVRRGRTIDVFDVKPVDFDRTTGGVAGALDYGIAFNQLQQIAVPDLHALGYTGAGVIIGVLDTGFQRSHVAFNEPGHPINVIAEYDFINDDPNTAIEPGDPSSQHSHGTIVLSTMAAYKPGEMIGAAFDASYILCKTEDTTDEYPAEEDNYVAGLEFIEANGGDIATASLGYIDWYTQADLDGATAVTTIGVNTATANGVICLSAAGNQGHDSDPVTSNLIAPADAPSNITVGAVASTGGVASFSSDGPTADGRVKPEVMARGIATTTVSSSSDTSYGSASGTSLSTPLAAGAVACLIQAHPEWSVAALRARLLHTASRFVSFGTYDPLFIQGYGIIDALAAHELADCNTNGIDDVIDIAQGTSGDVDGNLVPDECQSGACCLCATAPACIAATLDDCHPDVGVFYEDEPCANVSCPTAVPANDECASAASIGFGATPFDTRCSTTDGPATETAGCGFNPPDAFRDDIWFTYTANCDGFIDVSVQGADFDALVAVYCDGSATCACPLDATSEHSCQQQSVVEPLRVLVSAGNCYTIRVGGLNGAHGTGMLDIQASCLACFPTSTPQPEPFVTAKNRYLSFVAGDPGVPQAIRVTIIDLPPPFEEHEGESYWVGPPEIYCANAGHHTPMEPDNPPDYGCPLSGEPDRWYWSAALQCTPYVTDWTTLDSFEKGMNVHSGVIVPGGVYAVQTIDGLCAPARCSNGLAAYSDPYELTSSIWGDVLSDNATSPPGGPNAVVDISDVVGALQKFKNATGCPSKVRSDIEPGLVDFHVNISDVVQVLNAFAATPYPFDFVAPCP